MPDLNFRNPTILKEMQNLARYWLDLGVDGFCIDAIKHVLESDSGLIAHTSENLAWVRDLERFIKSLKPDAYVVGETWTDTDTIARYHEQAGLDYSFNYPRVSALIGSVQSRDRAELLGALEPYLARYPQSARQVTFISNHDQVRPGTALGFLRRGEARLRLAAGLLLTLLGTPFIYYGEELGLPHGPGDADEEKHTPMPWDGSANFGFTPGTPWCAFSSNNPTLSVTAQEANPDSLLNLYKTFIGLRNAHPALKKGGGKARAPPAREPFSARLYP